MNWVRPSELAQRTVPPIKRQLTMQSLCASCGQRLGLHRVHGDNCPNPFWFPCSGKPEWQQDATFRARIE
jgi:hypothetical protein